MRNVTQHNITDAFINYMSDDTDPRLREILTSLAKHMHAFAKDVNLKHEEWEAGLNLLEKTANFCSEDRHEFVLLSDLFGLSSLVDLMHSSPEGTSSSVLGPFHVMGAPDMEIGADMKRHYPGPVVLAQGIVKDVDGNPIQGALIDIWQTAPNGLYASQDDEQDMYSFHGIQTTGADGRYAFTTVKPVMYEVPTDGTGGDLLKATGRHAWRPSHLHFIVKAEGYRSLVSEVFAAEDKYLDQDAVFGVRSDLIMEYVPQKAETFPKEGFELSGKVDEDYLLVDFDLTLIKE